jgi:uncharacterized protein (DUF302 family)
MRQLLLAIVLSVAAAGTSAADSGIISKPSRYTVPETITRLESVLKAKGVGIFAKVDHGGEASKAGLQMRPAQLLIFGNPKAGTPLMNAAPLAAIDLPLKALAWEDAQGKVWLSYNSPAYIKERHKLPEEMMKPISSVEGLIDMALQ